MKSIMDWLCSCLPVFIAVLFLVGAAALCSGCYTLKQGTTMLGYLGKAVPLEELAGGKSASGGNSVSEEDRLFVQRVTDIRRFATEELGLKESKNYTRYVDLDRDYLAAVVSASANDSFTRHEWWFPVVGRVPYKGFFSVDDARRERAKLEKKELDVWIRRVDAFSTLGWFRDPLYSYMKKYSDRELADLIIHELFHATVFIKNQVQFNEELAEFIGSEGARLYTQTRGLAEETDAVAVREDSESYLAFIRGLIAELDAMYKSDISREEKLKRKEEIIAAAKTRFGENYDSLFKTENYKGFLELPVNNAYLELYRLYYEEDHFFKDLYERSGRDLPKLIAAAKTLNNRKIGRKTHPKEELEKALGM